MSNIVTDAELARYDWDGLLVEMMGWLYLRTTDKKGVYKIGKTDMGDGRASLNGKCTVIRLCMSYNCKMSEIYLKKKFKETFQLDRGSEYFSGDLRRMMLLFDTCMHEYESNMLLKHINREKQESKEKVTIEESMIVVDNRLCRSFDSSEQIAKKLSTARPLDNHEYKVLRLLGSQSTDADKYALKRFEMKEYFNIVEPNIPLEGWTDMVNIHPKLVILCDYLSQSDHQKNIKFDEFDEILQLIGLSRGIFSENFVYGHKPIVYKRRITELIRHFDARLHNIGLLPENNLIKIPELLPNITILDHIAKYFRILGLAGMHTNDKLEYYIEPLDSRLIEPLACLLFRKKGWDLEKLQWFERHIKRNRSKLDINRWQSFTNPSCQPSQLLSKYLQSQLADRSLLTNSVPTILMHRTPRYI